MARLVPVSGGLLSVESLPGVSDPVLAIHGVSSNRRLWNWLRAEAPQLSIVAPDLRGRGASVGVPGPSSLRQHADDLVDVLDALGIASATVLGMSMGGFVAVELAARYPSRVQSLLLVDGGLPVARPALTREQVRAAFAPQLGRVEQHWPNLGVYVDYFLQTAPLLDRSDPLLLDYLAHDLADGRIRLSPEHVVDDAVDVFTGRVPWRELTMPVQLLHAEWATGPGTEPMYSAADVAGFVAGLPLLSAEFIPGVDHGATVMTRRGAAAVARHLLELLQRPAA